MKIIKSILLVFYLLSSFQLVAQNTLTLDTVLDSIVLWKSFSSLYSKLLKYYLVLVALSFLGLSIYLTWHGLIGMRLWSY